MFHSCGHASRIRGSSIIRAASSFPDRKARHGGFPLRVKNYTTSRVLGRRYYSRSAHRCDRTKGTGVDSAEGRSRGAENSGASKPAPSQDPAPFLLQYMATENALNVRRTSAADAAA